MSKSLLVVAVLAAALGSLGGYEVAAAGHGASRQSGAVRSLKPVSVSRLPSGCKLVPEHFRPGTIVALELLFYCDPSPVAASRPARSMRKRARSERTDRLCAECPRRQKTRDGTFGAYFGGVARVAADDDGIERFVVCRYLPVMHGDGPPHMEDLEAFDSLDEAMALLHALKAGTSRLADATQAGGPPYEYTLKAVEAGTLRRDRNLQAVMDAWERGEDFERLPEYQDLPRSVAFAVWRTDPETEDPGPQ
jgi:hypothetical protein